MKKTDVHHVFSLLNEGAVGVLPTDTMYGVVCAANNPEAAHRLYQLKSRDKKPGTLIAATTDQLVRLGLERRYINAVSHYWPNPISVVIPCASEHLKYLHLGRQSLAVRLPDNDSLYQLLIKTGPLLTSSANLPGQPPAKTIAEAQKYFGDQIDFYVADDIRSLHMPSTVLQVIDDGVVVLRQGAATINEETGAIESHYDI